MKFWEIVKGMCEEKYNEGNIFQNAGLGDIIIEDGVLVYEDSKTSVEAIVGDTSEWTRLY